MKNIAPKNDEKLEKGLPKGRLQIRDSSFLFDTTFETLPQTGARAPRAPKIIDCSSKSEQKVTRKLTYLSSLCFLRNICGELGDPKMAPSFALYILFFSLQAHGENHPHALSTLS